MRCRLVVVTTIAMAIALSAGCADDGRYRASPRGSGSNAPKSDSRVAIRAPVPPPPLSGGVLHVSRDGTFAVVSDPLRDRLLFLDIALRTSLGTVALQPGDEPGRIAEDGDGRIHVALRRGGAVATVNPADILEVARRPVCPAPRGIAYNEANDRLHVACAGGELVTLGVDPRGRQVIPPTRHVIEPDLRDVVVQGDWLFVSRFRSSEVLMLDAERQIVARMRPEHFVHPYSRREFDPTVAWRMLGLSNGEIVVLHQRAVSSPLLVDGQPPGGLQYYQSVECADALVQVAITRFRPNMATPSGWTSTTVGLRAASLAVDMSVSANEEELAVVTNGAVFLEKLYFVTTGYPCGSSTTEQRFSPPSDSSQAVAFTPDGELLSVPYEADRVEYLVNNEAGQLSALTTFYGADMSDTGWEMFHEGAIIACASCHPEGRDDGHLWDLDELGPRRTQSLSGGVSGTEPFHWDGELRTMDALVEEVMARRMGLGSQPPSYVEALALWLDSIPLLRAAPSHDDDAFERGEALFQEVGCTDCHAGYLATNNATVDVGTGRPLQVPSLRGLGVRAPYMHDNCAPTLFDRFGSCGGGDEHGVTSQLSATQIDDLVAYLERL